jgi:hypothetical protein
MCVSSPSLTRVPIFSFEPIHSKQLIWSLEKLKSKPLNYYDKCIITPVKHHLLDHITGQSHGEL